MKQHVVLFDRLSATLRVAARPGRAGALVAVIAAAAVAAGCGKSSDLVPVTTEAKGILETYQQGVTELEQRAQGLDKRRGGLENAPDAAPAMAQLDDALRNLIPTMQRQVREAQARIAATAGDAKLDDAQRVAQLRAVLSQAHDQLATSWVRINARLDAVEAWMSRAESRPRAQAAATPPPPPPPPDAASAAGGTFPAGDPRAAGNDAGNAAR